MPVDREIHFGFIGPAAIYKLVEELDVPVQTYDEAPTTLKELRQAPFDLFEMDITKIEPVLEEIYDAITARLGWTKTGQNDQGYTIYQTPFGERVASSCWLCLNYDPDEIGDEPEDATIGINLSSRYFPCILDIENPHGTLGNVVDFDALVSQIAICREEIVKRLPAFADAKVFFREIFY
jgi:hypothetical protein